MRRAGGVLVVAAAAAALTGCGGGNSTAKQTTPSASTPTATTRAPTRYERQMQVLGSKLSVFFASIGRSNVTASTRRAAQNLERVQARLRDAAAKLSAMKPPAKIKAAHQHLIAAVREYANELNGIIKALEGGDRTVLARIPRLQGVRDMGRATTAITHAGYDIIGTATPSG